MSSLYKSFKTNKSKENSGVAIEYAPNADGTVPTFWVARLSETNKRYQKVSKELYKPYRKSKAAMKSLTEEVAQDLLRKGFVKGCLIKWENIQDTEGNVLEFSEENAYKLFDDLPDLLDNLMEQASDISMFLDEQLETDVKN